MDNTLPEVLPNNNDSDLSMKLNTLECDNRKMREEFDGQRAKMKEIYLQKESECKKLTKEIDLLRKEFDDAKSQLVIAGYELKDQEQKAQEEIRSLQQLVHETIDESSVTKSEYERLHVDYEKLKCDNHELREAVAHAQQDSPSLAPVLSHVKKTLARKLGADISTSHDNLEANMQKVNKYAQEDAEMLRSLVIPLEEEIKALKEKLRTTDEELQKHRGFSRPIESALVGMLNESKPPAASDTLTITDDKQVSECKSTSMDFLACEMCQNYELQLVHSQNILKEAQHNEEIVKKDIVQLREDLEKEAALRKDLERQWHEQREAYREGAKTLEEQVTHSERELGQLQKMYQDTKEHNQQELQRLIADREMVDRQLDTLQRDNDFLSGRFIETSEELQNQPIDMPNDVVELQEHLLKSQEKLIEARVGCELEQRKCQSLFDETQLLRTQINDRHVVEQQMVDRIKGLEHQHKLQEVERQRLHGIIESHKKKDVDAKKQASELSGQAIELREANDKLDRHNRELKMKMSTLQQDLSNSEAVQKDFVRLSQSLQMELEKIRAADTQIRWQDDEDVDHCPNCKNTFTVTKRKQHCRHCGTIYCERCLTKSVPSGRNQKVARVCEVCHTLLMRNTAPYFSQAPPQSPV